MRSSTISKHQRIGYGSPFAVALGETLRERRQELSLTQDEVGHPLSRAFISQLERGRVSPSLGSLALIAERLSISLPELLDQVNRRVTDCVNSPDDAHRADARRGGSGARGDHRGPAAG